MVQLECPWCEEELTLPASTDEAEEGTCPHCLTTWSYVTRTEPELAQAA